jgi:type VI secretion system secreted protein VgrG
MHHRYAYGTNLQEAQGQLKKVRQRIATEQGTLSGSITSNLLSPGYTFKLTQPLASKVGVANLMRQSFSERTYVVTSIQHKASDKEAYKGTIQATEVNAETDSFQGTLLTPFSMDGTQQGSVLAKVVKTAVPRGWRYREKSNFQVEQAQNEFQDEAENEKGCLVQFATARSSDEVFWVRLSQGTQTAPEVGAMVSVSRANNDSELPEFNVLASHGQKAIQPADRRNQSWTANTNWGSNYSTSYGDGISLRWGYSSPVNFKQAKTLVENAYDKPDMLGNTYDNSSFSRGGSFSVSTSNQDADGVSNASVSMGSSFSENHAKVSYGYSDTDTSQNYSQVGKSVSRSVIGKYSGKADLDSPNFINGKVPEQSIIDIADTLNKGDTYNENYTKGRSISLNGNGAPPPSFAGTSAISYSNGITVGNTESISHHIGDASNNSTHIGNNSSSSTNIGNSFSESLQLGNTFGSNTFLGTKNDMSTTLALNNSLSTNIGLTNQVDTYIGKKNTLNTHLSETNAINTDISANNSITNSIGKSNSMSTKLSASNNVETNIGISNNLVTNISASNSIETNLGLKNSLSTTLGMYSTTNINASMSINNSIDMSMSLDSSTKLGVVIKDGVIAGAIIETEVAPIKINATKPATEVTTESLTKIEMLTIKIML